MVSFMMSSRIGLLVFAVLSLAAYLDVASAQCRPGQRNLITFPTLSCPVCSAKCGLKCGIFAGGQPGTGVCKPQPLGVICTCCCGNANPPVPVPVPRASPPPPSPPPPSPPPPSPPPPSPPPPPPSPPPPSPPPPPPPSDPRDLCGPGETSLSTVVASCSLCPVCNCGAGVTPALAACISNYCSCCCPTTLTSSSMTPGSALLAAA
ncbi:hypothetical protein MKW92_007523 [Papaver armeniacum]|nr:hypothetical protein MKW92_007523 [Papaver armeniacum]